MNSSQRISDYFRARKRAAVILDDFFIVVLLWKLLSHFMFVSVIGRLCSGGGGHSHVRGIRVCAALTTPFSGSSAAPATYLFFTNSVSSYVLHFLFFQKFGVRTCWPISLQFRQNFSSKHTNFGENLFPRPYFFLWKNPFCRPYFWKPVWHIPTKKKKKKKIECPFPQLMLLQTWSHI